ncbi:MAG: hypothetical protein ACRC2H_07485 [Silanimonas sp.]
MFGGVRDVDWTHIRVEGDRQRAAAYLPQARLLLGEVRQTLQTTGRGVEVQRRLLPGGVQLEAKMIGAIPIVTIRVPPPPVGDTQPVVLDGFIGIPIFQNTLRGVSGPPVEGETFDEVVLSPGAEGKWSLFTYAAYPPYTTSSTARTLSYRFRNGIGVYPEGMDGVGSNDWHGPRGEVLSWLSPVRTHGYLRDVGSVSTFPRVSGSSFSVTYVKPSHLRYYDSRKVFNLGALLFATDEYRDEAGDLDTPDPYFWVAGACIHRGDDGVKLYVAQYALPAFLSDYSIFEDDGAVQIYRYDVVPKSEAQPQLGRVVSGSRVAVGAPIMLFGNYDLVTDVMFNRSGTEATLVLNPSMRTQQTIDTETGLPALKFADPAARIMRVDLATGATTVTSTLADFFEPVAPPLGQYLDVTTRMSVFHHYRGDELVHYRIHRRMVADAFTEAWLETPDGGRIDLYDLADAPAVEPPEVPITGWGYRAKFIHAIRPREGLVCLLSVASNIAAKTLTGAHEVWVEDAQATSRTRRLLATEPSTRTWAAIGTPPLAPSSPGILALGGNASPTVWAFVTAVATVDTGFFYSTTPMAFVPILHLWGTDRLNWSGRRVNEPVPYGLNTGYALGLTTDIPLGIYQQANVLTGLPSTPHDWPTINAPGLGTDFKTSHTRFVAQGRRWMLTTYAPFTADQPVTYVFDGESVHRLLGADGINVSFSQLGVMGRPIFLPST